MLLQPEWRTTDSDPKAVVLQLEYASESPEDLGRHRLWAPPPEFLIQKL